MQGQMPNVEILGVPVMRATREAALGAVEAAVLGPEPALIAYVNAHSLNTARTDEGYRAVLRSAALVLNDGVGMALAGRLLGAPFPANLNGSDLNPRILDLAARRGWKVYLLGAGPQVAEEAGRRLQQRHLGLDIVGVQDGFFPRVENAEVVRRIADSGADLVMVAMGNPIQEKWLADNLGATGCRAGVGVGAFFDFEAEIVPRAPSWMNRVGLEWVWRLAREPRRLWRRYVIGNPLFLGRVVRQVVAARRSRQA